MQKNILQKQKKHQNIIPKEEFTGKNLTRFGGVGLFRRFFERIEYYVVVPQQSWVQRLILHIGNWREIPGRRAVGQFFLPLGKKEVRFVVIRKPVKKESLPESSFLSSMFRKNSMTTRSLPQIVNCL